MLTRLIFYTIPTVSMLLGLCSNATAQPGPAMSSLGNDDLKEWNNQIRREKFDLVLPQVMRKNRVDMWIHVMRIALPDAFGAEELGSTSGVFVFTDRGGDRIERAVLGRRWGAGQRERVASEYKDPIEELGAYDIIHDPIFVREPLSSPMIEYDFRY